MKTLFLRLGAAFAATAYATSAHAHPGHGTDVLAGLLHPLLGMDHLLAILAVGVWAARLQERARWLVPASFLAAMAVAAAAALAGLPLPAVELGIAGSVLLAGLLLLLRVTLVPAAGAALVAAFAVFHGYAHGAEMPAGDSPALYIAGFLLTTAILLLAGRAMGRRLARTRVGLPATGSVLSISGGWLVAALA